MSASDPGRGWVERVLGVQFGSGPVDPNEAVYRDLRPGILADLQRLRGTDPKATAQLAGQVAQAQGLADSKQFQRAAAVLNQVAEALASRSRAASAGEAASVIPKGTVAAMKERLERSASRWDQALKAAQSGSQALQAELGPDYGEEAEGFARIIDSYWAELSEPLRAAAGRGDEDVGPVLQVVARLRDEIAGDELLQTVNSRGIGVQSAYATALAEVEKVLTT